MTTKPKQNRIKKIFDTSQTKGVILFTALKIKKLLINRKNTLFSVVTRPTGGLQGLP